MKGPPTAAQLWSRLEPHVQVFGPADAVRRPAVLMFHGCGGVRGHLPLYAQAAAAVGVRAFVVDSYAARGWSRAHGLGLVCTGLRLWGRERAGDVLASARAMRDRPDVDADRLALAGWSHGGWSIMDLMTMPLQTPGEAALADPDPAWLGGVRSLFLAYAYGSFGALSRRRDWVREPAVLAVIPHSDHLTRPADVRRIYAAAERGGCAIERWDMEAGTHSFDETTGVPPMRHHPEMAAEARRRFAAFLERTLEP